MNPLFLTPTFSIRNESFATETFTHPLSPFCTPSPSPPPRFDLHCVKFLDDSNGYVAGDKMFSTRDGGKTWKEIYKGTHPIYDMHWFDFDHGWIVGGVGTIAYTNDGGLIWKDYRTQETGFDTYKSMFWVDNNFAWLTGDARRIVRTTDGGASWQPLKRDPKIVSSIDQNNFTDIFFIDRKRGWVGGEGRYYNRIVHQILYTEDGGESWNAGTFTDYRQGTVILSLFFINKQVGFAGGACEFFKTTDAGRSWEFVDTPILNIRDIGFFDQNFGWFIGRGQFHKTTDGGKTWRKINIPVDEELEMCVFINSHTGFIVGSGPTILKTDDGGENWTSLNLIHP